MILRIVLVILSGILLSAHFLREGDLVISAIYLLFPLLFIIKKKWSLILLQIVVFSGVLIWIQTLIVLINARVALGQPWLKMSVILGGVILFTLVSGVLLNSRIIKEKYYLKKDLES